ncbi:major facilitator superfamily domain-containing protein [Aspergillus stella-maris]|uniref:major facilitator superfamily domain-containing protein n=1 Tax=Aspergillus stella-maris TaxID=1810926 RepID=UPI003CCD5DA4
MTETSNEKVAVSTFDSDGHDEESRQRGFLSESDKRIERKLVHKLDHLVLPMISLAFFLSIIDRSNYGAARLQHLEADLHMSDAQFQTGLSVFYVGYILFQVPSNMVLNHVGRPSWHIGLSVFGWRLVTSCTAAVRNFGGLVACRIVLGFVEAPLYPGIMFYLTTELTLRMSICLAAGLVAQATGSLIAAGISSALDGAHGLSAWRWLYLIEGVVSICGGFTIIVLLPDFPHTSTALAPGMRQVATIAIQRLTLEASQADVDGDGTSSTTGLKLALADKKLYIVTGINMCIIGAVGCQNFFPTLTATLGYSHIVFLLLVAPPYFFAAGYSCLHSWVSDRTGTRFWYMMYPAPIAVAGFVLFMAPISTFGVRYFSMFLMLFIYSMNSTITAWLATSISRPPAKRAAAYGIVATMANTCSIWTPYTYRLRDSPHFRLALGLVVGMVVLAAGLSVFLRMILVRENEKLEEEHRRVNAGGPGRKDAAEEGKSFRYTI